MGNYLKEATKNVEEYKAQLDALKQRYTKTCDYFNIDAKNELRDSTVNFFKFFKQFSKDIEDSIPKNVKSKKKPPGKGNAPGFHAELMAKLQAGK